MLPRHLSLLLLCLFLLLVDRLQGATPRDFAIDLTATTASSAPFITLSWTQRIQANITAQKISRRVKGATTWVPQATLSATQTSYADPTAVEGVEYEYWMERTLSGVSPTPAMGFMSAGANVPMIETRGTLLLVIDDTMVAPLAPEIAQLKADLVGDGWNVVSITALRGGTPQTVKAQIVAAYNADPGNVKSVYLLGHVPVPYSGAIAPDGHGDHVGAWPADGYYADMDGTWTDSTVNSTTASATRNRNIPGDGKFDQSSFPSLLELQVGRVDLSAMTKAPASIVSETALLRRYLRKAHDFRHKRGAYASIPRRTLVRDGFGYFGGENFAISSWAWAFTGVGQGPAAPIDEPLSDQWFSAAYAGGNSYLLGYGCGGGSYESASSVGSSTDFGRKTSRVVFTSLFGSYHGDWDSGNNFMRAPLAGNATGDSLGLACFWGGRPNWFMHHFGMGETIGYSTRISQNGGLTGGGAYTPGGSSFQGIHLALMGDPALRLHIVEPPRNLSANSSGGHVSLAWDVSSQPALLGYLVYRAATPAGPFTRLTATPLASPGYVDASVTAGQPYTYLVRTLALESVPGGSYQNLSQSETVTLTASSAGTGRPLNPSGLTELNGLLSWVDNSSDETGFRIERRLNVSGTYATIGTVGAGVTSFTDPGPLTQGNVYYYRVFATGAAGDSLSSEEISLDATAGFFELSSTTMKVSKAAGVATFTVNRFGGSIGAVSVQYATSDSSATAGTHYLARAGTLNWAAGDLTSKTFTVGIINTGTPQLPRQFKVTLNTPSTGTAIAAAANTAVLIEDPTASLDAQWSQTLLPTVADSSPAVSAENSLGAAIIGGSGVTASATSEAGRFIYQQRTGDGVLTAFVPAPTPSQTGARFAVMVRGTLTTTAAMAAAVTSGDAVNFGAKLASRTTVGGAVNVLPVANNNYTTPRWLRLSRAGNSFTAESSTDGNTWTFLGSATTTLPATAYWGLFHYSAGLATTTTNLGDYQLATFQNVAFSALTAPEAPANFSFTTPSSTQISLSWATAVRAVGYRIERRAENGSFAQIADLGPQIVSYDDTTVTADSGYEYRILAYNAAGDSPWSLLHAATPLPDLTSTFTTDQSGNADATVRFDSPTTALGQTTLLTMAGGGLAASPSSVAKIYFRFDLNGVPALKTATLKLAFVAAREVDASHYIYGTLNLLSEASDVWDEAAIDWNNAPQNAADVQLQTPTNYLGYYYLPGSGSLPAAGTVLSMGLSVSELNAGKGANGLATIAFVPNSLSNIGAIDFAAREHATLPPPTLEVTYTPAQPLRPSFLTASVASGLNVDLQWADNASDETGFEIERRVLGGSFALLQILPANATSFTDTTRLTGFTYEYRIRATGLTANSSWSLLSTVEGAGILNFASSIQKVSKAAGQATLSVTRSSGALGAISIGYATADSSASSGTHYSSKTGTLSWADGDSSTKSFTVPVSNTGNAQLPRQFKVNLSAPGGGAALGTIPRMAVLIEDFTASLSAPWSQTVLGSVTDSSPAVNAEGTLGGAIIGGSGVSAGATSEAGRFIYQQRNGDGVMTLLVPTPMPAEPGSRLGVMIRGALTGSAAMGAAVANGDSIDVGAKLAFRSTDAAEASVLATAGTPQGGPIWLRLTRTGGYFTAESSTDGSIWKVLGTGAATLPDAAFWGIFHFSEDPSANSVDYQLATFDNVSFGALEIPSAPTNFTVSNLASTQVDLIWNADHFATGYHLERRAESGTFTQIADLAPSVVSYSDLAVVVDSAYEYRIQAYNALGESPWVSLRTATRALSQQPLRPAFLSASVGSGQNVELLWTDNASDETGYEIQRRALGGTFGPLQIMAANATSFVDMTPLAGVVYEYRLRATGSGTNSSWSLSAIPPLPDTFTAAPILTFPSSNSSCIKPTQITFTLPETAAPGTLKLSFGSIELVLADSQLAAGTHSFSFNPATPTESAEISTGSAIPDGTYTVTLSFQDSSLHAPAMVESQSVLLDATIPTIVGPFSPLIITSTTLPDYTGQAQTFDTTPVTVTQVPAPGATIPLGLTTVTVTATDTPGNRASQQFVVLALLSEPAHLALVKSGELAPGAGYPKGPPADAIVTSFGLPAIDNDGHFAYLANWKSVTAGKGTGIFRDDVLLVQTGAALGSLLMEKPTATYRSFTDPVLSHGRIAFLGTVSGVPASANSIVASNAPTGSLIVLARSAQPAPDTGGGKFKSFQSVAVTGDAVTFLAQLTLGTGLPITTASNDVGLWMRQGRNPLRLVLRKGQIFNGKVIRTLATFRPGNGSPGHGRGWFGEPNGPVVMALAQFADAAHSQAVLAARADGVVYALSESGPDGVGAPGIGGSNFASYGLPSSNDLGHASFLATLTLDVGGITSANARGIFAKRFDATFAAVARTGDVVLDGAAFSAFKDPVLSDDDALAFPATLKGGSLRGLATSTLWWRPVDGSLSLLAQGSAQPPETPAGAQWKDFLSLALADANTPIFAATLVAGQGGVIPATDRGVWAKDYFGNTRLLFRAGVTKIGNPEKTLKSFSVLKAVPGSLGVTRSFNQAGEVIWRATFTDNSQAIIRTSIP